MIVLGTNVLIEKKLKPKKDIIVLEKEKEYDNIGVVVQVGQGRLLADGSFLPLDIKEKDEIVYNKYAATHVKLDNNEYYIIPIENILMVINRNEVKKDINV